MSKIDLDRLIVRRTYFVPVKSSQLKRAIENELNSSDDPIIGISPWFTTDVHGSSFHFMYSMKYMFLYDETWGMDRITDKCKKLLREKLREFEKEGVKSFHGRLKSLRGELPRHLYVRMIHEEENGCRCKVECLSVLYDQLAFFSATEASDFEVQNAYLGSKRFLETIFESGLSATLVSEEKKLPLRSTTQFLVNDQTSHNILTKIETMLDEATVEVLVCGWVGTLLLPTLKELKGKKISIRIMTHKSTELKGKPGRQDVDRAHKELMSLLGKENISMSPECHFRVLVVDNKALVGSMDFNAISLTGTHREFAIYTEDPEIVRSIRNYFNQIFTPLKE